jgi:hypothetical protein
VAASLPRKVTAHSNPKPRILRDTATAPRVGTTSSACLRSSAVMDVDSHWVMWPSYASMNRPEMSNAVADTVIVCTS